jgi:hypothetical protein
LARSRCSPGATFGSRIWPTRSRAPSRSSRPRGTTPPWHG